MTVALGVLEAVAALLFGWAMWYARRKQLDNRAFSHLSIREWHHAYLGVLLYGAGLLVGWPLQLLGVLVTWDDAFQHAFQAFHHRVQFRSPLHRAYAWLWTRWPLLQRVSAWLDVRF